MFYGIHSGIGYSSNKSKFNILFKNDVDRCDIYRLKVQLVKKYPHVSPSIKLEIVRGLTQKEQKTLSIALKQRCRSLAESGLVMVCELVQLVENFLISHNKDPTNASVSAWDQMKSSGGNSYSVLI